MSEQTTAPEGPSDGGNSGTTPPAARPFAPITSQDDLNKVIADRIERERAKFADYGDLRAKAAKLDEIEEANKTEAQRLTEQAAQAKAEAEAAKADLLRYRIAAQHGITEQDDIDLLLTGRDEETLTKQAQRFAQRVEDSSRPRSPRPDPNQARGGSTAAVSPAEAFAEFTRRT